MALPAPRDPLPLARLGEIAAEYARHVHAPNTLRAYRADWRLWESWCSEQRPPLSPLPAEVSTVAAYLLVQAEGEWDGLPRKPSTLERYLATICSAHKRKGCPSPWPALHDVLAAIRRKKGTTREKKAPISPDDLRRMIASLPHTLRGARDRALLLVGFLGALRRSELISLDAEDVDLSVPGSVRLVLGPTRTRPARRTKANPEGDDEAVVLPAQADPALCPIATLRAWIAASGIRSGALFRGIRKGALLPGRLTDSLVARLVQRTGRATGLDPARLGGHSLRAGLATTAARRGKRLEMIARQTRHRDLKTLMGYIREVELEGPDNAAAGVMTTR